MLRHVRFDQRIHGPGDQRHHHAGRHRFQQVLLCGIDQHLLEGRNQLADTSLLARSWIKGTSAS